MIINIYYNNFGKQIQPNVFIVITVGGEFTEKPETTFFNSKEIVGIRETENEQA